MAFDCISALVVSVQPILSWRARTSKDRCCLRQAIHWLSRQSCSSRALELVRGAPVCQHYMERATAPCQGHWRQSWTIISHDALRQLGCVRYWKWKPAFLIAPTRRRRLWEHPLTNLQLTCLDMTLSNHAVFDDLGWPLISSTSLKVITRVAASTRVLLE